MDLNQAVIELESLRKEVCLYGGATPCDCKFYVEGHANSEASGCAELRVAIANLEIVLEVFKATVPHPVCALQKSFHQVNAQGSKVDGGTTLVLKCDKRAGHPEKRHHDPETGAEWLG